jgi:hypothetical protein
LQVHIDLNLIPGSTVRVSGDSPEFRDVREGGAGDRSVQRPEAQNRQQFAAARGVFAVLQTRIPHFPPKPINQDGEWVRFAAWT